MSARRPEWDSTPERRALWDHTAAQTTPVLLDSLDVLDAMPSAAMATEHYLTRMVIIDVLQQRHSVDPVFHEDLEHLWDDEDDEQTYGAVLRAAIAFREQVTR